MTEKMMLENKRILILDNEYRLSIIKNYEGSYEAHLSDYNSAFSAERTFFSHEGFEDRLINWIKEMNAYNNPELRVFAQLKQWNGVIE